MAQRSEPTATCPLCGGVAGRLGEKAGFAVHRCCDCRFLFVSPYPSAAEIAAYYSEGYREADADFYPKLASRKRRAFLKSLRFLGFVAGRRALDVGCGGGIMVDAFRRLGAEAHGLDISENSIRFARKAFPRCTFHCSDFESMAASGLRFDFIFTSEVMEHLAGPHECLRMIDAVSGPGTRVYVATPDAGHPLVPDDLLGWNEICPPEHIQWFDRASMTRLFEGYGFSLVKAYPKRSPALSMLFRKRGRGAAQ